MSLKKLFVAGLTCVLAVSVWTPAVHAQSTNAETRVNVIEPALDLDITETTLLFGQGTPNTTVYGTGTLNVTFSDAASAEQDTTGWSVGCAATQLSRTGGGANIAQANLAAQRTALTFTSSTGTAGNGAGMQPTAGTTAGFTALTGTFYLFKAGGTYASTSVANGTLANMYSRGTWTTAIPGSNFRVSIPSGQMTGTYTGTLTMTITRGLSY